MMTSFWDDRKRLLAGAFAAYISDKFSTWYALPKMLEQDLSNYQPDGSEMKAQAWDRFQEILSEALFEAHRSVHDTQPAYHNLRHFVEVVEAGMKLLCAYEQLLNHGTPDAVKQAFLFALAVHDCGHSGSTFRSQAPNPEKLFCPEAGVDVSTEYVSMITADEQAKQFGFNPAARLFIAYVIASTTYGGKALEGRRIGIDHIEPNNLFGWMTRLADVCPKRTWSAAIFDDCSVNLGEYPAGGKPDTVEELIQHRQEFCQYVIFCMDKVDELAGVPLTSHLGWRQQFIYAQNLPTVGIDTMEDAVNSATLEAVFRSFKE